MKCTASLGRQHSYPCAFSNTPIFLLIQLGGKRVIRWWSVLWFTVFFPFLYDLPSIHCKLLIFPDGKLGYVKQFGAYMWPRGCWHGGILFPVREECYFQSPGSESKEICVSVRLCTRWHKISPQRIRWLQFCIRAYVQSLIASSAIWFLPWVSWNEMEDTLK